MQRPPSYVDSQFPSHVCRLHKSLYSLKQAPRDQFDRFTSQLLHLGFVASLADSSLLIYHSHHTTIYLLLYVDDIIITGNNPSQISHFITTLSHAFELKDLGALSYFLSIQILPTSFGLTLCQSKYGSDVLHHFHMENAKPLSHPAIHPLVSLLMRVPLCLTHLSIGVCLGHSNI